MSDSIGVGLLLNILFWTVAVLAVVGLGSLAVIEYFPGREHKTRKATRGDRRGLPAEKNRVETDEAGEGYRKAS